MPFGTPKRRADLPTMTMIARQLDAILKREGWPAYTNRPADRGGPTRGGITLRTLIDWRQAPQSVADLKALTEHEARAIYRARYLQPWEFIEDADLFAVVVDYAVTSGHDDPTRALQYKTGVKVDGILGPVTRAAVLQSDPKTLREAVIAYRVRHMVDLALNDRKLKVLIAPHEDLQIWNLRGWVNRATSFLG